jgi:succinyl-diaminopimelate desuccinylase
MEGRKAQPLQRIESDREVLLDFSRRFIGCPSPNPPGDTREAAAHIRQFLAHNEADCGVIAPNEIMPNIIATFSKPANLAVTSRLTEAGGVVWPKPRLEDDADGQLEGGEENGPHGSPNLAPGPTVGRHCAVSRLAR